MKVRTKLSFLFLLLLLLFISLIFFQKSFEKKRLIKLFKQEEAQITSSFDKILELKGASVKILSVDYTYWGEMVDFVKSGDLEWAKVNLDSAFATYGVNATWVFRTDNTLVFANNNLEDESLKEIILSGGPVDKIYAKNPRFNHFFINTKHGLMEIRASTIHPSEDDERKTPPQGYFLCGKLWSNEYIAELSRLTGCNIVINLVSERSKQVEESNPAKGIISFTRKLKGQKENTIAILTAWKESEIIRDFNRTSAKFFLSLISSVIVILIILLFLLTIWVSSPLRLISGALFSENPGKVERLRKEKTEFGEIAKLIANFFEQKKTLLEEMDKRKHAEEEVKKFNAELEIRIKERTKQLEEANNALIQSEKMSAIGILASGVAHELKNPNAVIIQGLEFLKSSVSEPVLSEYIQKILKSALRADKIVKDMLNFSRQTPLVFEEADCVAVVEESLSLVEHQMNLANIQIVRRFSQDLPKVKMDANQMKQVFINILVNAIDAMPKGGVVTISLEKIRLKPDQDYLQVVFTDTGCGIPEEHLKKIFNPFFSTKKQSGSAGLGLAIIKRIIERHNGVIDVKSKVGSGASIIVYLPSV